MIIQPGEISEAPQVPGRQTASEGNVPSERLGDTRFLYRRKVLECPLVRVPTTPRLSHQPLAQHNPLQRSEGGGCSIWPNSEKLQGVLLMGDTRGRTVRVRAATE